MIKFALVMPTLNASPYLKDWHQGLCQQTVLPLKVVIVDSSSNDDTVALAESLGLTVHTISRSDFDHGGTRQYALRLIGDVDFVVFMTQDVKFYDNLALENILDLFSDSRMGMSYGKQLPHLGEGPFGTHARLFNYGDELEIRTEKTIPKYKAKSVFCSNSFACYRVKALEEIGGFPMRTILSEDFFVSGKLILAGWEVAYVPSAKVYHSHSYTILQEARRYFDIGVFYSLNPWITESFGKNEGNGLRFVLSEFKFLLVKFPYLLPSSLIRNTVKYLFFKLGFTHKKLPKIALSYISMNKKFFSSEL